MSTGMKDRPIMQRGMLILAGVWLCILMSAATYGTLLSTGGQPGHITAKNAFIAPLIGPWSHTLPPNARSVGAWPAHEVLAAVVMTVLMVLSVTLSCLSHIRIVTVLSRVLSAPFLLFWVIQGLLKVILEIR